MTSFSLDSLSLLQWGWLVCEVWCWMDFHFLEFVKGWRGGLRCMISYHKIDNWITKPWCISTTLRSDSYISHLVYLLNIIKIKIKKGAPKSTPRAHFCKCILLWRHKALNFWHFALKHTFTNTCRAHNSQTTTQWSKRRSLSMIFKHITPIHKN